MLQPANVATPPDAARGFDVQLSTAPEPGWELMARVTDAVELTVLPPLSSMLTTGWVLQVAPFAPPLGVVMASWLADPAVMLKVLEVWVNESPKSVAVST
jgi:hypothetical protein